MIKQLRILKKLIFVRDRIYLLGISSLIVNTAVPLI